MCYTVFSVFVRLSLYCIETNMTERYVKEELCKRLDEFGRTKKATNTVYRKFVNWDGESRWTLLFDLQQTLEQSADFVNSTIRKDAVQLDTLPATYMFAEKYAKRRRDATEQHHAEEEDDSAESDHDHRKPQTVAKDAVVVAQNVDRILSMKCLHESLCNVQEAIVQFCNKKRYKKDDVVVALFFSLLNAATRIAQRIQEFLNDLKAMP